MKMKWVEVEISREEWIFFTGIFFGGFLGAMLMIMLMAIANLL